MTLQHALSNIKLVREISRQDSQPKVLVFTGIALDRHTITSGAIQQAVLSIYTNTTYTQNAQMLSVLFRSPGGGGGGVVKAANIVEKFLRIKNTNYTISAEQGIEKHNVGARLEPTLVSWRSTRTVAVLDTFVMPDVAVVLSALLSIYAMCLYALYLFVVICVRSISSVPVRMGRLGTTSRPSPWDTHLSQYFARESAQATLDEEELPIGAADLTQQSVEQWTQTISSPRDPGIDEDDVSPSSQTRAGQ
jgi:hypothetical protein